MENPIEEKSPLQGLPVPGEAERELSLRLEEQIRTATEAAGGALRFDRFMDLVLYTPGLGYYSSGLRKFGEAGDFVTAPEISRLFSACVARQSADVLSQVGGDILEFGAGSGAMAAAVLQELRRVGCLPDRYLILEVSGELRRRQERTLREAVPGFMDRVSWLTELPDAFTGVVLANEVLDAMSVQRFRLADGDVRELAVVSRGGFRWEEVQPDDRLRERVMALRERFGLPDGYESEVNFRAEAWAAALGGMMERGLALLIDYGFPAHEYYHPQRREGTLMCHYRHRSHPDPLVLVGLQDITAHVDFTAIAEAAHGASMDVMGFTNQGNFLMASGLLEMAAEAEGEVARMEAAAQVKRLTMPSEMGELFKVLALGRGIEAPLRGFAMRDDRGRL